MNADDDQLGQQANEIGDAFMNAENVNFGSSDLGKVGVLEWMPGNKLVGSLQVGGTSECVRAIEDESNNRAFCFWWNSIGNHYISCFSTITGNTQLVLLESQVVGGLGITRYYYIHSVCIIGSLLYWTNGANDIFRINVEASINFNGVGSQPLVRPYSFPIAKSVVTVIRKPPIFAPKVIKIDSTTTSFTNNVNLIAGEAFLFCLRYGYRDGEISTTGVRSGLVPLNDTYTTNLDGVKITIPLDEKVGQDVQIVELIAKYLMTGDSYVVKTWDKTIANEATEINQHNLGLQALTFYFFNTFRSYGVDTADMIEPYHAVPLTSQALDTTKARLYLANNTFGYDPPAIDQFGGINLSLSGSATPGTDAQWFFVDVQYYDPISYVLTPPIPNPYHVTGYILSVPVPTAAVPIAGWYYRSPQPTIPLPATITAIDFTTNYFFMGSTVPAALIWLAGFTGIASFSREVDFELYQSAAIISATSAPYQFYLKTDATYIGEVTFFDEFMRSCDPVQNINLSQSRVTVPDRNYTDIGFNYGIRWSFPTSGASGGPFYPYPGALPVWAYYYSVGLSKDKKTEFFASARANTIRYFSKDPTTGEFVFTATTFAAGQYGLGFRLDNLNSSNLGYSYQAGDIIKIWLSTTPIAAAITLAVKDTYADYLIADLKDIGDVSAMTVTFEIYSPLPPSTPESFFEQQIYAVIDPGLPLRRYSVSTGVFLGDTYRINRVLAGSYAVEAMSPNDKYWQKWFTNAGRQQFITRIGRVKRSTNIVFSDVYVDGTKTNGLSAFHALNSQDAPIDMGAIQSFKRVSKINDDGTVALAIGKDSPASIYIGETLIQSNTGSQIVAQSNGVIGTINVLRGGHGTESPESVIVCDELVFWLNTKDGMFVQYSNAGAESISAYKNSTWAARYCAKYRQLGAAGIIATGQRPFIVPGYLRKHRQIVWSMPAVETVDPYGNLPGISNAIPYPFNFYDNQQKTVVYKGDANRWLGSRSYIAESAATIGETMYTFKNGKTYAHSGDAQVANFYGVQGKVRLMYSVMELSHCIKEWTNFALEGCRVPDYVYFMTREPNIQCTDLFSNDVNLANKPVWKILEGVPTATLKRDRLTPGFGTAYDSAMIKGDILKGNYLLVLIEWIPAAGETGFLRFVNHGFKDSRGQIV